MSRSLDEVQKEYSIACSELGQKVYQLSLMQEEVEKREYEIQKLQSKCKQLNNEGAKLMGNKSAAAVELPDAPVAQDANEAASEQ